MPRVRPSVFIGSSSEGLSIAKTLQVLLDHSCEVTVWSQGVFGLSEGTLESLTNALERFDFAILALSPDDMTLSRGETTPSPRDNVLFELGLFIGGLGKNRTFLVYDRTSGIKLPSDIAGVTTATFEPHKKGELRSALGAAATTIEERILRLGLREEEHLKRITSAAKGLDSASSKMNQLVRLMARSRKVELEIISSQFGPMIPTGHLDEMKRDLIELEKALLP